MLISKSSSEAESTRLAQDAGDGANWTMIYRSQRSRQQSYLNCDAKKNETDQGSRATRTGEKWVAKKTTAELGPHLHARTHTLTLEHSTISVARMRTAFIHRQKKGMV